MKKALEAMKSIPLKPSTYNKDSGLIYFFQTYKPTENYNPTGKEWALFHNLWTGTSQIQFYDVKDFLYSQLRKTGKSLDNILRVSI